MCLFLITLFFLSFSTSTFAQTPTLDPKAAEIKKMYEKKVQDIRSQDNVDNSTNTPKAIIGTINQISDSKITIINLKKESENISITDETIYIDIKKNKTKLENLKSGQTILIMGYYDQYNSLNAKRIVITSYEEVSNKNEIVFGQIVDISQTSNVIVLISNKNKETQYQIKTDSKTKINNQSNDNLTIDKLKSGQKIIAIIQPDAKITKTFNASKIVTLNSNSQSPTPTTKK